MEVVLACALEGAEVFPTRLASALSRLLRATLPCNRDTAGPRLAAVGRGLESISWRVPRRTRTPGVSLPRALLVPLLRTAPPRFHGYPQHPLGCR